MKYLICALSFTIIFTSLSCSNGDNPGDPPSNCSSEFAESFEDEIADLNSAASTYGMDPSSANCQAFKDAYQDYIDALDDWDTCAVFYNQTAEWEQALDDAQEALDDLVC